MARLRPNGRHGVKMTAMPSVRVRLFAGLREAVGQRELNLRLHDGATVEDLREAIAERYPLVRALLGAIVAAVDEEYVEPTHVLREGESVALIPPVSGGR